MGNLEEMFSETVRRIDTKTNILNEEQKEVLIAKIDEITMTLKSRLQNYKMSSRVLGNIEDKLRELCAKLSTMNQGQARNMAEEAMRQIEALAPEMEELALQREEDKENITNHKFDNIQNKTEESKNKNQESKDNDYIQTCVKSCYNDIQRDIRSYIQTEGAVQLDLKLDDVRQINDIVVNSYVDCVRGVVQKHNGHLEGETKIIQEQVAELQQNVQFTFAQKNQKLQDIAEEVFAQVMLEENLFEKYTLKGKELENFNKIAQEIATKSQKPKDKSQENVLEDLPGDVL